jgi:hypothetical protein
MSLILVRKTDDFAAVVCDERMRIENRNGGLIRIEDGHNKVLILRSDLVIGITGISEVERVLRHRLLKFFHECSDPDLFERLQDKISEELRTLFISFSDVLSDVHLSGFIAVVLVGIDRQKIRSICWNSASAPDFPAIEYDDDFLCLGNDLAASYAQLLLSLSERGLGPSESLIELESVAHEVAKKYPECVSPSGFSFLVCPTNVEDVYGAAPSRCGRSKESF